MWPWIKVKVSIISTWCILMSEAVTVPNLMMTINSFQGIACEGQTRTHTRTHAQTRSRLSSLKFALQTKTRRTSLFSYVSFLWCSLHCEYNLLFRFVISDVNDESVLEKDIYRWIMLPFRGAVIGFCSREIVGNIGMICNSIRPVFIACFVAFFYRQACCYWIAACEIIQVLFKIDRIEKENKCDGKVN